VGKTKAQLEAELAQLKKAKVAEGFVSVANNLIKYGAAVAIAYFLYKSLDSLAGRETISNIGIKILTDMKVNQWLAYLLGGGGVIYGRSQNKLRKKDIGRYSSRVKDLESRIDPRRSSSKLQPNGETLPEDVI